MKQTQHAQLELCAFECALLAPRLGKLVEMKRMLERDEAAMVWRLEIFGDCAAGAKAYMVCALCLDWTAVRASAAVNRQIRAYWIQAFWCSPQHWTSRRCTALYGTIGVRVSITPH